MPKEIKKPEDEPKKISLVPDSLYAEEAKRFKKYPKSVITNTPQIRIYDDPASAASSISSEHEETQYHAGGARRPRADSTSLSYMTVPLASSSEASTSFSDSSLGSSITRFRDDFDGFKCKMRIFDESLDLCRCIARDFKGKLTNMDKRLLNLEKRQTKRKNEKNYSAIIQKNKELSSKTKGDAKKLQLCGTEEEMREVAGRICRNYLHGAWKTVKPADLDFRRISGGLSNFLYYVALPDEAKMGSAFCRESSPEMDESKRLSIAMFDEPKKVLLRIYGQVHGERAMDAIVTESVIFTLLSERRLGPKLYGVFSGGRIEEYIPARALLTKELAEPALSMKIAEKMAAIHSMDIPLCKEPNWLWKTMSKWLKTVKEDRLANGQGKGRSADEQIIIKRLKTVDFDAEIEWLKKFIATVESPVMFCHNDMQEGNILILEDITHNSNDDYVSTYVQTCKTESQESSKENNHTLQDSRGLQNQTSVMSRTAFMDNRESRENFVEPLQSYDDGNTSDTVLSHISDSGEPRLVLIDFEYCSYNYRGFDIANHFQEWGYDYTNPEHPFYYENQENCPTLEQKEIFIKEYLKHYNTSQCDNKEAQQPNIDAVNHLLNEVDAFALASHLFWSLWSIVNASKSQIPFGYWEYALSRLETYLRLKQEVIKKDKFGLPQKRKICEVDI